MPVCWKSWGSPRIPPTRRAAGYGRLGDGTPNGYMEENAFIQVVMGMPAPSDEEIVASYAEAQKVYASHGITTAQDGMTSTENAERLEQFGKSDACYMVLWATLTFAAPPGPFRMTPIPITALPYRWLQAVPGRFSSRAGLPG